MSRSDRKVKKSFSCLLFVLLFGALPLVAADLITFEDQQEWIPDEAHAVTIGIATFSGAKVSRLTNDPSFPSRVLFTHISGAHTSSPLLPTVTITFSKPVRNIEFDLQNGWPPSSRPDGSTQYSVSDLSHVSVVTLGPFLAKNTAANHSAHVTVPFDNVTTLQITASQFENNGQWDFAVDNIQFEEIDSCNTPVIASAGTVSQSTSCNPAERLVIAIDGDVDVAGNQFFHLINVAADNFAQLPLGARFTVKMQLRDSTGAWHDLISACDELNTIVFPLPSGFNRVRSITPLYPDAVLIGFGSSTRQIEKRYNVIHTGSTILNINPRDPNDNNRPAPSTYLHIETYLPSTLGKPGLIRRVGLNNVTKYDARLIRYANERGIPPQYLKAQIEQETFDDRAHYFNPLTWRYEPITVDYGFPNGSSSGEYRSVSVANPSAPDQEFMNLVHRSPYSNYAIPGGPGLRPDDVSPRAALSVCIGNVPTPIPANTAPTAREILANNPLQHFTRDQPDPSPQPSVPCGTPPPPQPPGRIHPSRPPPAAPDLLAFPAQTALASSYGLLQLIHVFVFDGPYYWNGAGGQFNPSLLFDTDANLALSDAAGPLGAAAGTLSMGATKDLFLFRAFNHPGIRPTEATQVEYDDEWEDTFNHYPGNNPDYGFNVVNQFAPDYLPQVEREVYTTSCSAPVLMAQTEGALITPGTQALLGVVVGSSGAPPDLDWYAIAADGVRVRQPSIIAQLTISPAVTTTYVAVASTPCGTVTSAPITVRVVNSCPGPAGPVTPTATLTDTSATLRVPATGSNLTYQWITDTDYALPSSAPPALIVGESPTISVPRLSVPQAFRVYITNQCETLLSEPVVIEPAVVGCPSLSFTSVSASASSVTAGTHVILSALVVATEATYQWFTEGGVLVGSDASVDVTVGATSRYYAVASNACGSNRSALVTVTAVCAVPAIVVQPASTNIVAGSPASLSVVVTGATMIQWFDSAGALVGSGQTINVTPPATNTYYALATNACGSVPSNTAAVTVSIPTDCPISFAQQPHSVTVTAGMELQLTALADDVSTFYQWFESVAGGPWTAVPGGGSSTLTISLTETASFYVQISKSCGARNSDVVTVTVIPQCVPPGITVPPRDIDTTFGGTSSLTVAASGTGPLHYQWFVGPDGAAFASTGSDAATLPITVDAVSRYYFVRVSNNCGFIDTAPVHVTAACTSPSLIGIPGSRSIAAGQSTTLTAIAVGDGLAYQWFSAPLGGTFSTVAGETTTQITVSPQSTTYYYLHVTGTCGQADSPYTVVTVITPPPPCSSAPVITVQPEARSITAGSSTDLAVLATGATSYQWYVADDSASWVPVADGTAQTLIVSPNASSYFMVRVSNDCGTTDSAPVLVSVGPACDLPQIVSITDILHFYPGDEVSFAVVASGTDLQYQWFKYDPASGPGQPLTNGTSAEATDHPLSDQVVYQVRVSNSCGAILSPLVTAYSLTACTIPRPVSLVPYDQTITLGQSATITATASAQTELHYQWYQADLNVLSWFPMPDTDSPVLTVSPTRDSMYYVDVSSACGTITMSAGVVRVQN